jgi:GNAT superfamily N-acetyltransferase
VALEALQMRASLGNPQDRDMLLRHPDAVDIAPEQIAAGRVFVSERDGVILGFYAILPRDDGDTDLDGLFVEPANQRQGIGRSLIEHCLEVSRTAGSAVLHVIGNPHVAEFYKACGFTLTGTFKMHFGDGLLLQRRL